MADYTLTQSGAQIQADLDLTENLQDAFSTSATYDVGDLVIHNSRVWQCHTPVSSAGAWTGNTNWTQIQLDAFTKFPTITIALNQVVSQDPLRILLSAQQTTLWDRQVTNGFPLYFNVSALGYSNFLGMYSRGDSGFVCENYIGNETLIISYITEEEQQITVGVSLFNPSDVDYLPEVIIEQTQIVQASPLIVELTDDQYDIFTTKKEVLIDLSDLGMPSVIWEYWNDDGATYYFGFNDKGVGQGVYELQIYESNDSKLAEYQYKEQQVVPACVGNGNGADAGKLLKMDADGWGVLSDGLPYLTTAPSAANTDGIKIVVLSSEPANRYDGYLYLITASNS